MLSLLRSIESITSCRDRDDLLSILCVAVRDCFAEPVAVGIFQCPPQGPCSWLLGDPEAQALLPYLQADWLASGRPGVLQFDAHPRGCCGVLPLAASGLRGEVLVLAFASEQLVDGEDAAAIETLARIFNNQSALLDYGGTDSLTGLYSRKNLEDVFERLLRPGCEGPSVAMCCRRGKNNRHCAASGDPVWLSIIDIDHFKHVNDRFGHVSGDHVLLHVGSLMRNTFRDCDCLFRFGGEEFVVMINAANEVVARACFDRFRLAMERHRFPHAGPLTCSIGFTAVRQEDRSTSVIARADAALYWVKNNGRNQTRCYERLNAEGLVSASPPVTVKLCSGCGPEAPSA